MENFMNKHNMKSFMKNNNMKNCMKNNNMKNCMKNSNMKSYMRKNMEYEMRKTISNKIYFILFLISERVLNDHLTVVVYVL
jgi:hypothetical protein